MNKQSIIQYVDQKFQKTKLDDFNVGDTVRVHVKIIEGTSSRIQVFEGTVICFKGQGGTRTFTVRKISFNVGVERVFPMNSPIIEKIAVVRSGQVRRAKLYYLRDRLGRASRLEEKETVVDAKASANGSMGTPIAPAAASKPELAVVKAK